MGKGAVKVIKYALFISNFLIMLGGLAVVCVGVWILLDRSFMERVLGTNLYVNSAYTLIAAGCFVVIISFLGCCGAKKEGRLKLILFFTILCTIFILMLAGGILSFVFRDKVGKLMHDEMLKTIPQYINDTLITHTWDTIQNHFQCCGVSVDSDDSYLIWKRNSNFDDNKNQVPESCCMRRDSKSIESCKSNPEEYSFNRDCHVQIETFVKDHAVILGGLGIGIAFVLVIGMILSCSLCLMIE